MWDKKFGKQRIYVMPTKQGGILKYCLNATETSVKTHFFLLLIYVSAFIMPLLIMIEQMIHKNKLIMEISILKLTSYVALNLNELLGMNLSNKTLETIAYQTKYDKRADRKNFIEFMNQ